MNDWQRLDELLERGLDFYGRQLVSEAIQCWREVLYLSPGHRLALEYLEAAGASAEDDFEPPPVKSRSRTSASMPAAVPETAAPAEEPPLTLESLSVLAVELIRERRLEEALALLYTAHGEAPKDQAISRSINVIKQKLTREYRAEIGDLGHIPHLTVDEALIDELDMLDEEREVLRLVDGIVALDDVVQTAGLGTLQIYRVLAQLLRRNLIVMKPPSAAIATAEPKAKRTVEDSARTKTAPFRPVLVPPARAEELTTSSATAPLKLVSLPAVPEPPKPVVASVTAASTAPSATPADAMPAPVSLTPAAGAAPRTPAPTAPAPTAATTTTMPKASSGKIATSTALPVPAAPAAPTAPPKAAGAVATSVTSVISASAAAASGVPAQQLEAAGSGAFTAILNAVGNVGMGPGPGMSPGPGASIPTDSAPRRPSAYAAHVAEAVRAHLQGNHVRAKELLAMCIVECPDDPAAKRNLQRLKERLGVKEER